MAVSARGRVLRAKSFLTAVATVAAVSGGTQAEAQRPRLPAIDRDELAELAEQAPDALRLFERAEDTYGAEKFELAEPLYAELRQLAPELAIASRRHCQVLTYLGRRDQALSACRVALSSGGSAMDSRAMVGALMLGEGKADPGDLSLAALYAKRAMDADPTEVWGHAASCDLARRLGDDEALLRCSAQLKQIAPDDLETRLVLARLPLRLALRGWLPPVLWGTMLLLALTTIVRRLRARRRVDSTASVVASAVALLTFGSLGVANAQPAKPAESDAPATAAAPLEPGGIQIDPENPEASLPTTATMDSFNAVSFGYLIMELAARSEEAMKAKDYVHAEKYYRAMAKAVPDRSAAFSSLCDVQRKLGNLAGAIDSCRSAVSKEGTTIADHAALVHLLLEKSTVLPKEDRDEALELANHVVTQTPADKAGYTLQCEVALKLEDWSLLQSCSDKLAKLAPDELQTVSYQWASAVAHHELAQAHELVERARALGMSEDGLARLVAGIEEVSPWYRGRALPLLGGGAVLALLIALAFWLSRRRAKPEAEPKLA